MHPHAVIIYMICIPALALIAALFAGTRPERTPVRYIFSILMYATCVPGVLAVVLTGYALLIMRTDILQVNALVYFLPILSMALTIAITNRVIRMSGIPGFNRLSGFMLLIGVSFVLVFILQRMFFGVVFFGTMQSLLILFAVIFILLKLGWERLST